MTITPRYFVIGEGWQYSLANANGTDTGSVKTGEWTPVKSFPTTVHVELLKDKKIPDPVRVLDVALRMTTSFGC